VRTAAIYFLSANYKDNDLQTLYKNALTDPAYSVLGSALSAIGASNPLEALLLAKQYEKEKSTDVLYTIADLYANYGSDENNDFFISAADKFNGFSKIGFVTQYGMFLKKIKNEEAIYSGAQLMESIAKDEGTSKWVAYYAKKSIKDLATMYEDREYAASEKLKKLKETAPNTPETKELEGQIEKAKAQKQKIMGIYDGLK
jgi:aminopeptidase N